MPKGQKLIAWTSDNDSKLLHLILATHDIKYDYGVVGAAWDPPLPSSCIALRMQKLRKSAAGKGLTKKPATVTAAKTSAPSPSKSQSKKASNGKNVKKENDAEDVNDTFGDIPNMKLDDGTNQLDTPPEDLDNDDCVTAKTEFSAPSSAAKVKSSHTANKVVAGRVTKKRASPRKVAKLDYHHPDHPYASMDAAADGERGRVFEDASSSSEDSAAEGDAFEGGEVEEEGDIPMEV
ncbi:MAG: hypothetical protein FRX48_06393 [Lasallia pustulata]|uniref:Uncharacterized protein n=1 Tax=Lasallia pustulata TaxID=136370 RepID=A0A5M8PKB9_9LECA|nr:MAG: hypothetical protein FRX48_06393 [Lasallia pustulata]